jgi:hypothetical protein
MSNLRYLNVLLCSAFLCLATAAAQQPIIAEENPQDHSVKLNVVVTNRLALFVTDLQQQDFAVFDDDSKRTITSFKATAIGDGVFRYQITFKGSNAKTLNEFHRVAVRINRPNLTVKTQKGYYAQPAAVR